MYVIFVLLQTEIVPEILKVQHHHQQQQQQKQQQQQHHHQQQQSAKYQQVGFDMLIPTYATKSDLRNCDLNFNVLILKACYEMNKITAPKLKYSTFEA